MTPIDVVRIDSSLIEVYGNGRFKVLAEDSLVPSSQCWFQSLDEAKDFARQEATLAKHRRTNKSETFSSQPQWSFPYER